MNQQSDSSASSKGVVVDITEQASVDDQAAKWVAKLDLDKPSRQTLAEFKHWINQSPEHKAAFESYIEIWEQMNLLSQLESPREQGAGAKADAGTDWVGRFTVIKPWLALSSIMLVALLTLQYIQSPSVEHYATQIGEQKTYTLPDGSTALLNTDTAIEIHYTDKRRLIYLRGGEAHFDVVSNPELPFEVYAGQGLVRAVGTAFSVYLRQDDVEVVVTEGIVEIDSQKPATEEAPVVTKTPPSNKDPALSQISAGNMATYDRHTAQHILLAELKKVDQKTAWHQGLLVFDDEPLQSVVAEVGRYTATKIHIPNSSLRQLKIGGQFKVGDTEAMFQALKISFGIQATIISKDLVYLELDKK